MERWFILRAIHEFFYPGSDLLRHRFTPNPISFRIVSDVALDELTNRIYPNAPMITVHTHYNATDVVECGFLEEQE
jgi:hypothetical protein